MNWGKQLIKKWARLLKDRKYQFSMLVGLSLMLVAFILNFEASIYTAEIETSPVGDLILDNIPTLNLNWIFTVGMIFVVFTIMLYPVLFEPEIAPFVLKTFAIFIIVRTFFIILTHTGAPEGALMLSGPAPDSFFSQFSRFFYPANGSSYNDLFFSAHTGIPFLGYLIYRNSFLFRHFLFFASVVMGTTVLFMHVHYSVDVFGAYFITYSIYIISDQLFNNLNKSFREIIVSLEKEEKRLREFIEKQKQKFIK